MNRRMAQRGVERPVQIPAGRVTLEGDLVVPPGSLGIVLFARVWFSS